MFNFGNRRYTLDVIYTKFLQRLSRRQRQRHDILDVLFGDPTPSWEVSHHRHRVTYNNRLLC